MAGSRFEAVGSIFTRVSGLIKSGALNYAERPLWYDVYAAFPPKVEPRVDIDHEVKEVREILYKEDIARARFYKEFSNPETLNMLDNNSPSIIKNFVKKFIDAEKRLKNIDEAYNEAINNLKSEGIVLKSTKDEQKKLHSQKAAQAAELFINSTSTPSKPVVYQEESV